MLIMRTFLPVLLFPFIAAAQPVTKKIDLLDVIKSGAVEYHVNPKADFHDAPKDIWTFAKDGTFNISGRGYGYVATKENYRDYHLVIEFKWGTKTWGKREKAAKDNGILLHAYGPHGAYSDTWMASIEAQIIEGGVGDILVLSPKLADGTELTTSLSAEFALDRDKEKIWKKGEPRQTVTKGRINWKGRDEDWADKVGFRGKNDVESPLRRVEPPRSHRQGRHAAILRQRRDGERGLRLQTRRRENPPPDRRRGDDRAAL
jgi:hypothetical protein